MPGGDQKGGGAARCIRRARHCDRGNASREAPALQTETFGAVARGGRLTAPSDAWAPARAAGAWGSGPIVAADAAAQVRETTPLLPGRLVLTPLERREFDFSDLNRWMLEADQAIRRTKAVLDRLAAQPSPPASEGA
jgi:hypothetical protein